MFNVVQKLRVLKKELRVIHKTFFSGISTRVEQAKKDLENVQVLASKDPSNDSLYELERAKLDEVNKLLHYESLFFAL